MVGREEYKLLIKVAHMGTPNTPDVKVLYFHIHNDLNPLIHVHALKPLFFILIPLTLYLPLSVPPAPVSYSYIILMQTYTVQNNHPCITHSPQIYIDSMGRIVQLADSPTKWKVQCSHG